MCGIVVYSKNFDYPINKALLEIKHRGPDKSHFFFDDDIFIGHALLQIRGTLNNSIQPKVTKNGRYILVYNGQIYNLDYLKNIIDIKKNELDTDCIIKLLDKFSINGLKYIDGMYAIVVYDRKNKEVIFTRDPSGQKNLYYYISQDGKIIISSEIDILLKIRSKTNFLSTSAAQEFFSIGLNPNSHTIISEVHKLLPGEIIYYSVKKNSILRKEFFKKIYSSLKLENKELIKKNILSHLPSKKKIALNLSGGIDSNLILNEILNSNMKIDIFSTFCECKDKNFNNDFFVAKSLAKKFNLNFIETRVTKKDYFDNILKVNEFIEEPNRNIANTLYFLNFKNQKKNNYKVILSGSGGDEVFIGYQFFFFNRKYQKILNKIYSLTNSEVIYKFLIYSLMDPNGKYCLPRYFLNKNNFYSKYKFINSLVNKTFDFQNNFFNFKKFYSLNFLKLIYGQFTWLTSDTFLAMDKLSMRNSVEMRSPFSCHEFILRQMRFLSENHFLSKFNKPLIRELYKFDLPEDVINNKKKTGWPIPKEWLLSGEFRALLLDLLPKFDNNFIRFSVIRKYIEKHPNNLNKNYFYSLLSFLIIAKKYKLNY
jgi:asparagine synthase (glutamine-hydrolysing)